MAGLAVLAATAVPNQVEAASAKIAWVSFHSADGTPSAAAAGAGFTQAPDAEYTQLLRAAGHEVTRYVTTATPDVAFLNTFDLVIVSRSAPSGHYQTEASAALWNGLTVPTLHLGGYVLRGSRLGYVYGETIPDTTGPIRLTVNEPSHPVFAGVALDASGTMVNPYAGLVSYNSVVQRGISVVTDEVVAGGTVLASVGTEMGQVTGGMIVTEVPAGTVMGTSWGEVAAAKRLVVLTGSREMGITSEGAGIFDLDPDGVRIFLNAVSYLAGVEVTEPPPLVSQLQPAVGATRYYAPRGMSFRISSGTAGGVPEGNITVVLNGTDVSSALTIGGTLQERTVSYSALTAGLQYTGTITVRDAAGRESTVELNFDTLAPFALPAAFAYASGTAVEGAPGFRARIVQGYDFPELPNTADRAEAQLAGTLIDPLTEEPYPDLAIPSTDNPDGSYNQQLINWNVDAQGVGAEIGNFRAPEYPDDPIPGINYVQNIAAEVLTYLELTPGRHVMGVNSDDGFVVFSGVHHKDLLAVSLGRFDGGRGSADTIFQFEVTEAGLYPFRLLYYQGGGGANLEWFTVDPITDQKVLVNDRTQAGAVRAWRQVTAGERPRIVSIAPTAGAINQPTDTEVRVVVQDGATQVQEGSVQVTLNGQPVTAQVSKAAGQTTIRYSAAGGFQGDTRYTVGVGYTDSAASSRTVSFEFTTQYVPPPAEEGANIVWVSFHAGDDEPSQAAADAGFTRAPDAGYTDLLASAGHTVTRYVTSTFPDVDYLNTFDLVIISRSVPSGDYQQPDSTLLWHSITKPAILMGGYILRASRLGYTTGETIPDTGGTIHLQVNQPSHRIFSGIALDAAGLMVNPYAQRVSHQGALQRGISVNSSPIASGGTVLATVGTVGDPAINGMIVGEFPAGTTMSNPSADVTAARRLVLLSGSREADGTTANAAGIYDLAGDGAKLFLNAVRYMAGLPDPTPTEVSLGASVSGGQLTLVWPEAGTEAFVLQGTGALTAPNWQAVGGSPTVEGGQRRVTVPTAEAAQYFRLFRP